MNAKKNFRSFKKPVKKGTKRRKAMPRFRKIIFDLFPKSMLIKLKYCQQIPINPASMLIGTHVFRLNSIFDPDQTTGGHQPYGHDEYANIYQDYVVVGAKATIRFSQITSGGQSGLYMLEARTEAAPLSNNPDAAMERSTTIWKVGISNAATTLVLKWSRNVWFKGNVGNISQGAIFGSNPAEEVFLHVMAASADSLGDFGVVNVNVQIEYIVKVSNPKNLVQS